MSVIRYRDPETGEWVPAGAAGATSHKQLTGLDADDHPQYFKKTGGTITGPLTVEGQLTIHDAVLPQGLVLANGTITGVPDPVAGTELVNRAWYEANILNTEEVAIGPERPSKQNIDLWVDTDDIAGTSEPEPFSVLETATTNANIQVTATGWAPLPNTWNRGSKITFTLPKPALVRFDFGSWFYLATGGQQRMGISVDDATPDAVNDFTGSHGCVSYISNASGATMYTQMSNGKTMVLGAGSHTAEIKGYKEGSGNDHRFNFTVLTATFIRYID